MKGFFFFVFFGLGFFVGFLQGSQGVFLNSCPMLFVHAFG